MVVTADFSKVGVDESVEGMGVVAPDLNIDGKRLAVKLLSGQSPAAYNANAGMAANGGFSDIDTKSAVEGHLYTFTFTPGVSVSNFSLHMLDFGDYNPTLNTSHFAMMTAYDANNIIVSQHQLSYTTTTASGYEFKSLW